MPSPPNLTYFNVWAALNALLSVVCARVNKQEKLQ